MSTVSETAFFNVTCKGLDVNPLAEGFKAIPSPHEDRWGVANWFDCVGNYLVTLPLKKEPLYNHDVYELETVDGYIYTLSLITKEIYDKTIRDLIKGPDLGTTEDIQLYLASINNSY